MKKERLGRYALLFHALLSAFQKIMKSVSWLRTNLVMLLLNSEIDEVKSYTIGYFEFESP